MRNRRIKFEVEKSGEEGQGRRGGECEERENWAIGRGENGGKWNRNDSE